jgi:hypothetical protein
MRRRAARTVACSKWPRTGLATSVPRRDLAGELQPPPLIRIWTFRDPVALNATFSGVGLRVQDISLERILDKIRRETAASVVAVAERERFVTHHFLHREGVSRLCEE